MEKYKEAGVDIFLADKIKKYIKEKVEVIGGFGGIFPFGNHFLVSSVDGVGTKTKIATEMAIYDTIGEDIVNHCINDILVMGAVPLYFMDYIGVSKLNYERETKIIDGIIRGCDKSGIKLIGGEIAEMPNVYENNEYDVVGFITGLVKKENLLDGVRIKVGDKLIGLPSNGLHTNGYSLVRKIIREKKLKLNTRIEEFGCTLGEELLKVHYSYKEIILPIIEKINGLVHITGGGFYGNIPRVLKKGMGAKIYFNWEVPPIFNFIQKEGNISLREMFQVFNMGIGMIAIVSDEKIFNNIKSYVIGEVTYTGEIEIV